MKLVIEGEPKEIAAFVLELQGQPDTVVDKITDCLSETLSSVRIPE